jgi:hypothetical protein
MGGDRTPTSSGASGSGVKSPNIAMSLTTPTSRATPQSAAGGSVHASPAILSPALTDVTAEGHHRCCVCFGDIPPTDAVAPEQVPCHYQLVCKECLGTLRAASLEHEKERLLRCPLCREVLPTASLPPTQLTRLMHSLVRTRAAPPTNIPTTYAVCLSPMARMTLAGCCVACIRTERQLYT